MPSDTNNPFGIHPFLLGLIVGGILLNVLMAAVIAYIEITS